MQLIDTNREDFQAHFNLSRHLREIEIPSLTELALETLEIEPIREVSVSNLPPSERDRALWVLLESGNLNQTGYDSPKLQALLLLAQSYYAHKLRSQAFQVPDFPERLFSQIPEERIHSSFEWIGFVPVFRDGQLGPLCVAAEGTKSEVRFSLPELFRMLFLLDSEGFYLVHNHPACELRPSSEDMVLTQEVLRASKLLRLRFLGHAVVSSKGSFWVAQVPLHKRSKR